LFFVGAVGFTYWCFLKKRTRSCKVGFTLWPSCARTYPKTKISVDL